MALPDPELTAFAREDMVLAVEKLMKAENISLRKAVDELGYCRATILRWRRDYHRGGRDALRPGYSNCGRKPKFELTEDEANALRDLRLVRGSLALAIEEFVSHPACLAGTRRQIIEELDAAARDRRMPRWPLSIRRAGYVSPDIEAAFRGRKAFQEFELTERRGMFYRDEEGRTLPVEAGTIYESDDMSLNEPFSWLDPETHCGEMGSPHPHQARVGRQTLCTQDVFSAAWLGCSPVGRSRDAYRSEDIADHVRHVVETHGLPAIWRFERGPWENSFIDGIELADGTRWGGLGGICKVVHTFKSRGKGGIESSFNLLQDLIAHASPSIGRTRGEFEAATKVFLRAGRGDEDAAGAFWDIAQAADGMAAAMRRFNARAKERRALAHLGAVSPEDLRRDARKRECPDSERWRLLPIKRQATVRGGCIETSVDHYPLPFRFRVNGESDLYFERGYQVLIAFHPGAPEEGCWIFNGEPTTSSRNRDGMKPGEFLMLAPMAEDAPQVNLAPEDREFLARKNANAAVRSEFRAITGTGHSIPRLSSARDGWGNSATRRAGSPEPARCSGGNRHGEEAAPLPRRVTPEIDLAALEAAEAAIMAREGILQT